MPDALYAPADAARAAGLSMTEARYRQAFLILLVVATSAAFIAMIREFLMTILLAAIFTGLSYPLFGWLLERLRGRRALAALSTLVLLLVLVMAPLLFVLGAGATEALRVTETIRPRLQQFVDQPGEFDRRLQGLPGYRYIEPYRAASCWGRRARSSSPRSRRRRARPPSSSFTSSCCSTRCSSS
jgi:predicted PurR-regulated permease PerM